MECQKEAGRDEMNLAEMPIAFISDRTPSGCGNVLVYEGQHGKLTVRASEGLKLPTAPDTDVIIGLVQLTKLRNNFTDATVPFTRHELLMLMGWPNRGQYYRRLNESLKRWVGITLFYEGGWWDNSLRCRVDASFHILDDVTIFDEEVKRTLRARQQPLPQSTFTWGKKFFQSCQANNLKRLDVETYFALKSAITKQMYRFLDKRFYQRAEWTFDLRAFAFGHVGLSRNYTDAKIKEKLKPALEELKAIGFLKSAEFISPKRGQWTIRLAGRVGKALEGP
jgi:hypothetical protein